MALHSKIVSQQLISGQIVPGEQVLWNKRAPRSLSSFSPNTYVKYQDMPNFFPYDNEKTESWKKKSE